MVQVDVFWSYGLASGLALSAAQSLKDTPNPWVNPYFPKILIWLACFFAPSGVYLLWEFPSWETMFVASEHKSIPAWLVFLFASTNSALGVLGYYVTYRLIRAGSMGWAKGQCIGSHFCMLWILFIGWDGTGLKRFTYTGSYEEFSSGVEYPWVHFFSSPVFYTLLSMGAVLVPTYFYLVFKWKRK